MTTYWPVWTTQPTHPNGWKVTDDIELPDKDITPDEAEPLPPDEPVKTDPIPEEE